MKVQGLHQETSTSHHGTKRRSTRHDIKWIKPCPTQI